MIRCNKNDNLIKQAIIKLPNGGIIQGEFQEGEVYENSGVAKIKMNGVIYVVSMSNVTIIAKEQEGGEK